MSIERGRSSRSGDIPIKRYVVMRFYCENCSFLISSYANDKGEQNITCPRCGAEYHRRRVSRRRMDIVMKAPKGESFDLDDAI
ncbi:MAG: hypothetical protein IJI78_07930 [Oscillospiraceae bacterium]|nr:hypothetical protein [Oscillospiraceae bacterium]